MEQIPDRIDSTFRYILIAAKRAEQLVRGAKPQDRHAESQAFAGGDARSGREPGGLGLRPGAGPGAGGGRSGRRAE